MEERYYNLHAHERYFVQHQILTELKPLVVIDDNDVKKGLIQWLTARYIRKAFPDAYNERMTPRCLKNIERVIKKLEKIEGIYIRLNDEDELDEPHDYEVDILLLMDSAYFEDSHINEEYNILKIELEDQINKCDGIYVESIDLVSNAGLTIKELQEYDRWDYSYLSYRDSDRHTSPIH